MSPTSSIDLLGDATSIEISISEIVMLGFKLPRRAPKKPPTKLSKALNLFKFACLGAALGLGYRFSDPLAEKAIAEVQMAKSLAVELDQKISTANESTQEIKSHDQAGVSAGLVTE